MIDLAILSQLRSVKKSTTGWTARCPGHDDNRSSLSIGIGEGGRVLLHCFAGCGYEHIMAQLNVDEGSKNKAQGPRREIAAYDYRDERGVLLYQVVRYDPKQFKQRAPDGNGGWRWNLLGVRPVLYLLPQLLAADPSLTVFICEGEKDADRLTALGLVATTNSGGSGRWKDEFSEVFRGRPVCILPDNDEAGRQHADSIGTSLQGHAAAVRVLSLPNLPEKGDISQWLDGGAVIEELQTLAATAPMHRDVKSKLKSKEAFFTFTTLNQLLNEPPDDIAFVWEKTLPCGGFSICAAKPKVGKSTFARNLAVAISRGEDFFGRATNKGKVIYLCLEEKRDEVRKHFERMDATGTNIIIHTGRTPADAITALDVAIREHCPVLVIIDPIARFVRLTDFNSYSEVTRSLEPLIDLARESECKCHILALHHNGKGEREAGDALLGSTAFFGIADSLLTMKRRKQVRTIETVQRYGEDFPETVVRLDGITGLVTPDGDLQTLLLTERKAAVLDSLAAEALTEPEIKLLIGGNRGLISQAIRSLYDESKLLRVGAGKKGDPYRYRKAAEQESRDSRIVGFPITENLENPQTPEVETDREAHLWITGEPSPDFEEGFV